MPVAALCPSCKAPLSETSVLALAPICTRCGVVITNMGGTLGMTSAYGVGDPSITRRRVEADLGVFLEYKRKYTGMLEACKQQLDWEAKQYADMPTAPELLETKKTLPVLSILGLMAVVAAGIAGVLWASPWVTNWVGFVSEDGKWIVDIMTGEKQPFSLSAGQFDGHWVTRGHWHYGFWRAGRYPDWAWWWWLWCISFACVVLGGLIPLFFDLNDRRANGKKPQENARRQKAYENAVAEAMKTAERKKAAEDHRLRMQIRELEGLYKTVSTKAADLRQILSTL